MAMRFPDLQVVLPRSVEVSRAAGAASHQHVHDQQAFAREHVTELARAQTQVRRKEEKEARVRAEDESERHPSRGSASRRHRPDRGEPESRSERPLPAAVTDGLGGQVDIHA